MSDDHYAVLDVDPQADTATIRAAYLSLMRAHHPDHRPGDPSASDLARAANAAWEVLGDATRRDAYDRLRAAGRVGSSVSARPRPVVVTGDADVPVNAPYRAARADQSRAFARASWRIGIAALAAGGTLLIWLA